MYTASYPLASYPGHEATYPHAQISHVNKGLIQGYYHHKKLNRYSVTLPSLLGGPGFSSTSPAITRSRGTTTMMALSSRVPPPSRIPFNRNVDPHQWQCALPLPPPPFSLDQEWTTYCSISDRVTTVMQPLSTRGVSSMTSPTPQLATPGWYSRPPPPLHLVWRGRHMW